MTQPSRVIYLPPGVVAGPGVTQQPPQGGGPSGVPFDREFFQQVLPGTIAAFGDQIACKHPIVQLLTVDGTTHYVKGLAGVADLWVALHTQSEETDQAIETFVPYGTIFRVSIHPCEDHNRRLGFLLGRPRIEVPPIAAPVEAPAPAPVEVPERTVAKKRGAKK